MSERVSDTEATNVIQGDAECRDGHYRSKSHLRTQSVEAKSETMGRLGDPEDELSRAAQNPVELRGTRIDRAYQEAAGIPALLNTARYGLKEMGASRTVRTLLNINKEHGFDCQSCARTMLFPVPEEDRAAAYGFVLPASSRKKAGSTTRA